MSAVALQEPEREQDFSLSALVRAALAGDEADPHRIAEDLIATMSLTDARLALAATLPDYVRKTIARTRMTGAPASSSSSRWQNIATLHASGELTLHRIRVFALGEWKFLGDCTRDDVEALAADRDAEAAANAAAAERFRRLLTAMKRGKAALVSDVRPDLLREIFDAT